MFFLALLFWPSPAFAADTRTVDRPLLRLEQKMIDARNRGSITSYQYESFRSGIEQLRMMREEAFADGKLTDGEKRILLKAIKGLEVDFAEARFGPKVRDVEADAEEEDDGIPQLSGRPVPRREPGSSARSAQ